MNLACSLELWLEGQTIPPIVKLLGVRLLSASGGTAMAELPVQKTLFNAMGSLHGGVFADLADITIGAAIASAIEPGELFTTTQLSVSHFAAVRDGKVTAKAILLRRGRSTGFSECELFSSSDVLVAKAYSAVLFFRTES